jgi:hypothetical protein
MWAVAIFTPWQHLPEIECPFKSILGIPCPTCGGIRAILALRDFHIITAVTMNPLVTIGLFGAGIWGVLLLLLPHAPTPDSCRKVICYVVVGNAVISETYLLIVGV